MEANADVNIGEVKSISGKALLGVTETEDGLKITINNLRPELEGTIRTTIDQTSKEKVAVLLENDN